MQLIKLNRAVWLILSGTFLINLAYWMTWPFLVVILNQQYGLSAQFIGALLSFSVLVTTIVGVYFGSLSDKIGRSKMLGMGGVLSVMAFIGLAQARTITAYVLAIGLVGLSRAILDPLTKAVFGDLLGASEDRALALNLRYFVVNLGAAFGPAIGVYMGLAAKQSTFMITAAAFVIFLFLLYPVVSVKKNPSNVTLHYQKKTRDSFLTILKVIAKDYAFLVLVVANILLWIVFVQFESSIALYFSILKLSSLVNLMSVIIFTNTMAIVLLQFPLMKMLEGFTLTWRIYLSVFILAISQLMFAFIPPNSYLGWIISTCVFSIAEVILVPSLNIKIDQMAPDHLRGSYFSVSFLYRIGFGAYLGGVLLQYFNGRVLFIAMFFICILIGLLYYVFTHLEARS